MEPLDYGDLAAEASLLAAAKERLKTLTNMGPRLSALERLEFLELVNDIARLEANIYVRTRMLDK